MVTLFWFLGCMNVWNLIDGMDGLASGVGLLVSGTLTLVAIHNENFQVAVLAVALAGSLAGFLLYNWHPACIFLGDSGSLLIGLLIGVIGVEGSMEGPSAISILFPILAMGLPISDTAMAIFRRWVRNLPLSAADRRHVHHLLIGLGLNPRQAALLLYCFSGFLCGAVMLGVALRNEYLTLVLGISGCLVFLLVVTSRRDELANLRDDLQDRLTRGRQERQAAKLAWEAIQRIELATTGASAYEIVDQTARSLGCELVEISHSTPANWTQRGSRGDSCRDRRLSFDSPVATDSRSISACRSRRFWRPTSSFVTCSACARRSLTGWFGSIRRRWKQASPVGWTTARRASDFCRHGSRRPGLSVFAKFLARVMENATPKPSARSPRPGGRTEQPAMR